MRRLSRDHAASEIAEGRCETSREIHGRERRAREMARAPVSGARQGGHGVAGPYAPARVGHFWVRDGDAERTIKASRVPRRNRHLRAWTRSDLETAHVGRVGAGIDEVGMLGVCAEPGIRADLSVERFVTVLHEAGERHGSEDAHDCHRDQQLDESEAAPTARTPKVLAVTSYRSRSVFHWRRLPLDIPTRCAEQSRCRAGPPGGILSKSPNYRGAQNCCSECRSRDGGEWAARRWRPACRGDGLAAHCALIVHRTVQRMSGARLRGGRRLRWALAAVEQRVGSGPADLLRVRGGSCLDAAVSAARESHCHRL